MAKQGMKRPNEIPEKKRQKSDSAIPELQGKQRNSKEKANPIIAHSGNFTDMKVFHHKPSDKPKKEKPISDAYPEIDSDLAIDNLQNDIPEADLQDLN